MSFVRPTTFDDIDKAEAASDVLGEACHKLTLALRQLHRWTMRGTLPSATQHDREQLRNAETNAAQAVMEVDHANDELVHVTGWLANLAAARAGALTSGAPGAVAGRPAGTGAAGEVRVPVPEASAATASDPGRRVNARRTA